MYMIYFMFGVLFKDLLDLVVDPKVMLEEIDLLCSDDDFDDA